jgi:hypothetical protein
MKRRLLEVLLVAVVGMMGGAVLAGRPSEPNMVHVDPLQGVDIVELAQGG